MKDIEESIFVPFQVVKALENYFKLAAVMLCTIPSTEKEEILPIRLKVTLLVTAVCKRHNYPTESTAL